MNFDFLNNVTITQPVVENKVKNNGRKAQEKNPTSGLTMRLFKDGSIYPSQELVDKFNLEYTKDKSGNGFDVFSSTNWNQYPKEADSVVFISATSKENTRVDLFSSAREVDGKLVSVLHQGSKTFGEQLIKMLENTYNTTLFTNSKYVDLVVVDDVEIKQDVVFIPKKVVKGVHAGTLTTERRENVVLMPLAIMSNNAEGNSLVENPANEMVELEVA